MRKHRVVSSEAQIREVVIQVLHLQWCRPSSADKIHWNISVLIFRCLCDAVTLCQKVPEGSLPINTKDIAEIFSRRFGRWPSDTYPDLIISGTVEKNAKVRVRTPM